MTEERLYETLKIFFWEKKCLPAVSRDYSGHHQISFSILEHKGDNNFRTERKGISFGVQSTFVTTQEGDGVVVVLDYLSNG